MKSEDKVVRHYESGRLLTSILGGLRAAGKDIDRLEVGDLAPVDEFHVRGRESTVELAERAGFGPGDRVLDVGCGIGGSARFLASEYRVNVSGIDLTKEFVEVGQELTKMVGMSPFVNLLVGSALELPFEDDSFDFVWTEHVQMNIADKEGFYREIARVLRPGGRFVFHDIFAGGGGPVVYPVPWANDDSISHLIPVGEVDPLLQSLGMDCSAWIDLTQLSAEWFGRTLEKLKSAPARPLGLHLLLGSATAEKFENIRLNMVESRIAVIQGVFVLRESDNS